MENLLKKIEKSEHNNPLLTAALQEIEVLKDKLDSARSILEMTPENTSIYEDGEPIKVSYDDFKSSQLCLLSDLLF